MSRHFMIMAVLICIGAGLRLANLKNVASTTPDERVYTYQASVWLESGKAGIRSLVEQYKSDAETRYYPPPTRVGMIRLVAAAMRWTGRNDESAGEMVSCAASIGSLMVLALIGIRFLPAWAAAASMVFYAVLPAELAVARRTWTDALIELAALLMIWCVCEITRGPKGRIWYPLLAFTGSAGTLIKESMPVPFALCALWVLWVLVRRREWTNALILISTIMAGMAASLWWLSNQVGSLADYFGIVAGIPKVNASNPYALEYASGPPYLLLLGFWIIAPVTSLLSLAGVVAIWRKRDELPSRALPLIWLAFFAATQVAIAMAIPHWLNLRYVGVAFGPFCLLAGLGYWYLISAGCERLGTEKRRRLAAMAVVIIIGCAVGDYLRFQRIFVVYEMGDLSIKDLMDSRD